MKFLLIVSPQTPTRPLPVPRTGSVHAWKRTREDEQRSGEATERHVTRHREEYSTPCTSSPQAGRHAAAAHAGSVVDLPNLSRCRSARRAGVRVRVRVISLNARKKTPEFAVRPCARAAVVVCRAGWLPARELGGGGWMGISMSGEYVRLRPNSPVCSQPHLGVRRPRDRATAACMAGCSHAVQCTLYSANRGRAQTPDRRAVASRSNIDRPSPHTSRERTTPKLRPEARAEGRTKTKQTPVEARLINGVNRLQCVKTRKGGCNERRVTVTAGPEKAVRWINLFAVNVLYVTPVRTVGALRPDYGLPRCLFSKAPINNGRVITWDF